LDENERESIVERIRVVERQIDRASDQKTLVGGLEAAYTALKESYEALADDRSELGKTLRALAAYRLAHLEVRRGDRQAADELFTYSARQEKLGPWPRLYRLALLSGEGATPEAKREGFLRALQAAKADTAPAKDPRLAGESFNMFELAAYFLGLGLTELDGSSLARRPKKNALDHRVVTHQPRTAKIPVTLAEAEAELDARAADHANAVCFRLVRREAAWRPPGRDWCRVEHRWLRLIAATGAREASDQDRLRELVDGRETTGASDDNIRQIRSRIKKDLGVNPWPDDPFTLAVPVIGVVHWGTFIEGPEPPVTRQSRPPGEAVRTGGPDDPPD
jgi:hypothetical protein